MVCTPAIVENGDHLIDGDCEQVLPVRILDLNEGCRQGRAELRSAQHCFRPALGLLQRGLIARKLQPFWIFAEATAVTKMEVISGHGAQTLLPGQSSRTLPLWGHPRGWLNRRQHSQARLLKSAAHTRSTSVTTSAGSNVSDDPQWQQSTFSPQPKRTRSAVFRRAWWTSGLHGAWRERLGNIAADQIR